MDAPPEGEDPLLEGLSTGMEELEQAGVTTELMEYLRELLEPTIHKTTTIEKTLTALQETSRTYRREMDELIRVKGIAEQQIDTVESFREEMSRWDVQRRSQEAKTAEELQMKTKEIDAVRGKAEQTKSEVQGHERAVKEIGEQMQRSAKVLDDFRAFTATKVEELAQRLEEGGKQQEAYRARVEADLSQVKDAKWSADTDQNKKDIRIKRLEERIEQVAEGLDATNRKLATKVQVDRIQTEVNEFFLGANEKVADVQSKLSGVVKDIKAHLKTAVDTVAKETAQRTSVMENQLKREIAKMAEIQEEVKAFIAKSQQENKVTEQKMAEISEETKRRVADVSSGFEEMQKTNRRNFKNNEMAIVGLKQTIAKNMGGGGGGVAKGSAVEAIMGVLNILMEGERLSSAMEEQDDLDRRKVSLIGLKDAKDQESLSKARKTAKTASIMSVDQRCLSCSGDAYTSMAGFKMACLNYAPTAVNYQETLYERSDIIRIRHHLIEQAFEQLNTLIAEEGAAGGYRNKGEQPQSATGEGRSTRTSAPDITRTGGAPGDLAAQQPRGTTSRSTIPGVNSASEADPSTESTGTMAYNAFAAATAATGVGGNTRPAPGSSQPRNSRKSVGRGQGGGYAMNKKALLGANIVAQSSAD